MAKSVVILGTDGGRYVSVIGDLVTIIDPAGHTRNAIFVIGDKGAVGLTEEQQHAYLYAYELGHYSGYVGLYKSGHGVKAEFLCSSTVSITLLVLRQQINEAIDIAISKLQKKLLQTEDTISMHEQRIVERSIPEQEMANHWAMIDNFRKIRIETLTVMSDLSTGRPVIT